MQYALLIYRQPEAYDGISDEQQKAISGEYAAIRDDPRVFGGAALHPVESATTVRVKDDEAIVTDGPFADTKEVFAGFYLLEAGDLDAALEIAARIPAARLGGSIEVRPVVEQPS